MLSHCNSLFRAHAKKALAVLKEISQRVSGTLYSTLEDVSMAISTTSLQRQCLLMACRGPSLRQRITLDEIVVP